MVLEDFPRLASQFKKFVIGLSGGQDSVAVLHLLSSLRLTNREGQNVIIDAIHVNHRLQKDAIIFQEFCQSLCSKLQITLHTKCVPYDEREKKELGIEALIEVHNRHELLQALDIGAHLIGINNRNLDDFSENLELTVELSKELPDDIVVISESGIRTIADVRKLLDHNVDGILVGEAFMSGGFDQNKVSKKIRSFMMVE